MADVSAIPFVNFGLSQQQQLETGAEANLANQKASLVNQQAQQSGMETELMQRSMPMYRQAIADAQSAMTGNPVVANSQAPTGYEEQSIDTSGVSAPGPSSTPPPAYTDPGAIAQYVKQQNFVQPFTPQEQRLYMGGAALASLPGPAANPMLMKMATLQNQFRTTNQAKINALRSNQLYDSLTAVQDPNNAHPFNALQAVPGQQQIAAQIAKDHPGDQEAQDDAARTYAQMAAYNYHQYTGYPTKLENGVEVDTERGQPVTGQQQVRTGLPVAEVAKIYQDGYSEVDVPLKNGSIVKEMKWKAPAPFGWGGITPSRMISMRNAAALQTTTNPASPTSPASAAAAASPPAPNATGSASAPSVAPPPNRAPIPRSQIAVGAQGQAIMSNKPTLQATDNVPSPTQSLATLPNPGTPEYNTRMQLALSDKQYDSPWARTDLNQPGIPQTGAAEGITQYQEGRVALAKDQAEMASTADTAIQNFQAAKMIFDSDAPMTGPIGALEQKIASTLGVDWRTVDGRQAVSKYLTQAAVSQLKQMYGSRPAAFDVKINLDHAFPNVQQMSPQAARNLIDSQIQQAQYMKQSAVRSSAYIQRGKDPYQFGTWNATYFPRSHLLDNMYGGQPPAGAETQTYQGVRYYLKPGSDRTKQANWVKY